ncbi:tRNA(Ile)-lysidine synthase [Candidatus Liberibacter solanacearum]|uniref:tRNA lysidine(34) synthetase TilS n=1 Tax=Candidatus Liberibacter solanacearum TaxID=556287 RepID=UPI003871E15D
MFLSPVESVKSFVRSLVCPAHILVAVSGGSDSIGLLIAFHSVLSDNSFRAIKFSAISVDHGIRDEAKDEVKYVFDICSRLGIPHAVVVWKDQKPKTGLMAAARKTRYALIVDYAMKIDATLVVTAHTFDDQLETVYMRSQRDYAEKGMGLSGISETVLYDMRLWIARPFLYCRREDIRSFLLQRNIGWCEDPSNADDRFERVRVRRLIQGIDPHKMYRKIEKFRNLRIAVNNNVATLIPQYLKVHWQSVIALSENVLNIDLILLSYLLKVSIAICGGKTSFPGYRSMERVIAYLKNQKKGCISIGRVVIDRRVNFLWITRAVRDLPTVNLHLKETAVWDGRYRFTNSSNESIRIGAKVYNKEMDFSSGMPSIVAQRAFSSLPSEEGGEPVIAPFSRFITIFDLPVAHAISISFDKVFIPQSPFVYEKKKYFH